MIRSPGLDRQKDKDWRGVGTVGSDSGVVPSCESLLISFQQPR